MAIICKDRPETTPVKLAEPEAEPQEKADAVIVCRTCSQTITRPEHKRRVNQAFSHTFANPHGQVFEIGCFSQAPGCEAISQMSDEFSWFKGYVWSVGICRNCGVHLGWVFYAKDNRFFGLILDQLIFP